MTPRRRKSTKPSAANSRPRRKSAEVTFLIDECLGRYAVPEALKAAGSSVILHSELFPPGVSDEEWLRALANRPDLSVLSKDRQIRKRTNEHEAVIAGRVRLFTLTAAGMNSREQADAFVRARLRIRRCSLQPPGAANGERNKPRWTPTSFSSQRRGRFNSHGPKGRVRGSDHRRRHQ